MPVFCNLNVENKKIKKDRKLKKDREKKNK